MTSKKSYDIAIIIPVYNVETYIEESIESLLAQIFKGSYQLILVNDCSPDNSGTICASYAEKYAEIILYLEHSTNLGVSVARNTGLKAMNAKYFTFVDPDDVLPHNALQALFNAIENSNADIAKGSNTLFTNRSNTPAKYNVRKQKLYHNDECLSALLRHRNVRGHTWGKIYRSSKLGNIRFKPNYLMAEDFLYCAEAFANCSLLKLIPDIVYYYRTNNQGAKAKKYETGAYKWWFKAVDKAKQHTRSNLHNTALFQLKILTLIQAAKEVRKLEEPLRSHLFTELKLLRKEWDISLKNIFLMGNNPLRSAIQYTQYIRIIKFGK